MSLALRRFLVVSAACAIGLAAGLAFQPIGQAVWPCGGEGLACSMTTIVGFIYTPVFAGAGLIAFLIAEFWKGTPRALTVAMLVPLVFFVLAFAYFKWSEISVREWHGIRSDDIQEVVQIAVPIMLALVVPWLVLLNWRIPKSN
jgi:hypothetical protein